MDDNFVDLAITPHEKEGRSSPVAAEAKDEPIYPFGTSISLETEQIDKLGLEDGEVGDYLHAEVLIKLCGLHVTETEAGQRKCMQLQITHISIKGVSENDSDEDDRPSSRDFYGRD